MGVANIQRLQWLRQRWLAGDVDKEYRVANKGHVGNNLWPVLARWQARHIDCERRWQPGDFYLRSSGEARHRSACCSRCEFLRRIRVPVFTRWLAAALIPRWTDRAKGRVDIRSRKRQIAAAYQQLRWRRSR